MNYYTRFLPVPKRVVCEGIEILSFPSGSFRQPSSSCCSTSMPVTLLLSTLPRPDRLRMRLFLATQRTLSIFTLLLRMTLLFATTLRLLATTLLMILLLPKVRRRPLEGQK